MELVAVTIAPILRIGSDATEVIVGLCLIVVARVHAGAVGRPQLAVIVIEDMKTTAATALMRTMHRPRNYPIRSLCPTYTVTSSEQDQDNKT
jgi:hypothetical protein